MNADKAHIEQNLNTGAELPALFEFIHTLWIKAQLEAPPSVQRGVIPRLHGAKEIARLLLNPFLPVYEMQGQGQGSPLTVTYIGLEFTRPFMKKLLFVEEPVDEWKNGFASNMLDVFYHDMNRWAFTFQLVTFITRKKTWKEILSLSNHPKVILERSIFTDRHVFAPNLHHLGVINDDEWQVYCRLWDFVAGNNDIEPDCILYLRTPAEVCLERIRKRGRGEETGIMLDYLQQLERLHDEWLQDRSRAILLDGTKRWTAREVMQIIDRG